MDASTTPVPDGGCLRASDCSSGGHCDCGYLNINFAAAACDRAGTCIATRPSCEPARPDDILCEEDGGCPLGGTCGGFGYCTTSWCSALDASTEAASDASVADSGDDGGGD